MSLPFLKSKAQSAGVIVSHRKPDTAEAERHDEDNKEENDNAGLEACASDLIEAVHSRDNKRAASAMRAAFELLESQPHEEAGEEEEEDLPGYHHPDAE
jgi:hypothetical protein